MYEPCGMDPSNSTAPTDSTSSISIDKIDGIKETERVARVRFNPKITYRQSAYASDDDIASMWIDSETMRASQHRTRKRAAYVSQNTEVAKVLETCLSDTTGIDFDPESDASRRTYDDLLTHHYIRGLEYHVSPIFKETRSKATRQILIMADKLADDNFLSPSLQEQWLAQKSSDLSAGSVRLARYLAEVDAARAASPSSLDTVQQPGATDGH